MFNSKKEVIDSFRKLWNGESYKNKPADTVMHSSLVIPEKDGTETVYFKNKPEPKLFKMCFTIEGIASQLDNFTHDVGVIYFFNPPCKSLDTMLINKTKWDKE